MSVAGEIKRWTGKDAKYWMDFIGITAHKHAPKITSGKYKGMLMECPQVWIPKLSVAVWAAMRKKVPMESDGNIICAKVMSLILTLWTCRIIRAKSYDKRRKLKDRQRMMRRLNEYHRDLMDCVSDESRDQSFFPKQEWDSPFIREELCE